MTKRSGFTLVEMLVAMAVTLLMMAALARAFAFVGERVRDSRGNVGLTNELRDVTTRLRDELSRCTVTLEPNTGGLDQAGYFLYYEGPMSNATSSIFGDTVKEDVAEKGQPVSSRYGDLDDYLAFTAVAEPGSWFTGKVPAYVLTGAAAVPNAPMVSIQSKYAEIIYFANADRDATGTIIDLDDDGLPDRVSLYRRVLLIRPDLNSLATITGIPYTPLMPAVPNWLTAMADVHQMCDLSLRRGIDSNGNATGEVFANSLADLSKPHNRFAHVRKPFGANYTSMPVLALEPPLSLLINTPVDGTPPLLRPVDTSTNKDPIVLENEHGGFLQADFVLSGDRLGEDLVASNCRAFDLQIFDKSAPFKLTTNNLVVGPSDVGFREALKESTTGWIDGGGFVDLAYLMQAGGPARGWQARLLALNEAGNAGNTAFTASPSVPISRLQSEFSGLDPTATTYPTLAIHAYPSSLFKSGRVIVDNNDQIVFFQPAFDTYTSAYERDGFLQRVPASYHGGVLWNVNTVVDADEGADGIDNNGVSGVDDFLERDTSAPFTARPEAIRITVRQENPGTRQLQQMSVIHRDNR
ncbi:PulJ/GspJ family protein [Novipirellula aureliae]|nr:prepilin-type N-terminal cleavage/methylation domain-containing protein [Novipirellula aureliae]